MKMPNKTPKRSRSRSRSPKTFSRYIWKDLGDDSIINEKGNIASIKKNSYGADMTALPKLSKSRISYWKFRVTVPDTMPCSVACEFGVIIGADLDNKVVWVTDTDAGYSDDFLFRYDPENSELSFKSNSEQLRRQGIVKQKIEPYDLSIYAFIPFLGKIKLMKSSARDW